MPSSRSAYNRTYHQRTYAQRRAKILARIHAAYIANPGPVKARAKAWYEAHKPEALARQQLWAEAHPEIISAAKKRWKQTHPEQTNAQGRKDNVKRRARQASAPINDLTHAQWQEIQAAQDHCCWYCGKRCKGKLTQDHIIPLSQGGSHTLHNVIGACHSCNSKKGNRKPPIPVQPLLLTIAAARKKKAS